MCPDKEAELSGFSAVDTAIGYMEKNIFEDIDFSVLCENVGYSVSYFYEVFYKKTGQTPAAFLRNKRLAYSCWDLAFSNLKILDISVKYRFSSQESFTRAFSKKFEITPGRFRKEIKKNFDKKKFSTEAEKNMEETLKSFPDKKVLKDVMKVGFYSGSDICPEDVPFPSCLASVLRYAGEDYPWIPVLEHNRTWKLNYPYVLFMGVSAMAFGFLWKKGWHQDNVDHMFVADPSQIIDRAFSAAGYEYETVDKSGSQDDEKLFRQKIIYSINNNLPVLAFGVVGPPECSIITGYDQNCDRVLGWSFFQNFEVFNDGVSFDENGYFIKSDWFANTWTLLILNGKNPGKKEINFSDTMDWIVKVLTTEDLYGRKAGIAGLQAWREQILDGNDFIEISEEKLKMMHEIHNSAVGMFAECRWIAGLFLRDLAAKNTKFEYELDQAASIMKLQHDLMYNMWDICGGIYNPNSWEFFGKSDVRRELSKVIEEVISNEKKMIDIFRKISSRY